MTTHPPAQLRRIRDGEWVKHRQIRLASLAESPDAFFSQHANESAQPEPFWQDRTATASGSSESATWIAEAPDGRWVGIAGLHSADGKLYLMGVWVDPAHRRRGIARKLIVTLLDRADRVRPGQPVHLDVNPRLTSAVDLYGSLGFVTTGKPRPLRPGSDEVRIPMVRPPRGPGSPNEGP